MHKRYSKRKPPTTSAFTIIELLIVIVVIGILATITIIAYSGIQQRARTAALTSSLSQAATKLKTYDIEIGSYPESLTDINIHSSEAVTYIYHKDNNSNPRSFCITAIKNNLVYKVTDTTQPSPGGCGMHEWPGGVVMTNLLANGDLSSGTTGWNAIWATNLTASNGVLSFTGTGTHPVQGLSAVYTNTPSVVGQRYYAHSFMRTRSANGSGFRVYVGGPTTETTGASQDVWYPVSHIGTATNTGRLHLYGRYSSIAASNGSVTELKYVVLINLTATFGAGNEPTKEQMDQILQQFPNQHFNGTVTANTQGIL